MDNVRYNLGTMTRWMTNKIQLRRTTLRHCQASRRGCEGVISVNEIILEKCKTAIIMKFRLTILTLLLLVVRFGYSQKQGYRLEFESEQQIRNYFANNIMLLDPLEGEYDIDGTGEYITPFVHQYYPHNKYKIYIVCNNNQFKVYAKVDGDFNESFFRIEPVGETNAYWMYFHTTATRIYLQDNLHFAANFKLDNASAKKFTGNNRLSPSVSILLTNDCVKVYPTSSMYANAARKAQEELKPTEWTGTGFALTSNYIVTNNHVVDGAKTISIQGINGDFNHQFQAEVVATDKHNDLAIIKVNGITISSASIPYAVKTGSSEVGEEVFVLGYPLTSTMGEEIKLTTGVISSKTGFQGDVSIYQISAPIQPGNSGGPLFDSKGNVIGIVSAKHKGAENVGYAIKTSYLRNLMESAVSTNILPQTNRMSGHNLSGKVKLAKNYVYYIKFSSKCVTHNSSMTQSSIVPSGNTAKNNKPTTTNPFAQQKYESNIQAAQNGDAKAQYEIGQCYQDGLWVPKDISVAIEWFLKSADQNYSPAFNAIGVCYFKGDGVPIDYEKAAYWFKKAAERGSAAGEVNYKAAIKKINEN